MFLFVSTRSQCQSKKYPVIKTEGKDTVVVMTVKQADAINIRFDSMKKEIDSLKTNISLNNIQINNYKKEIDSLKSIKPKSDCDSLSSLIKDWAYKPTFIYFYNDKIHTLDLSLYKIKFSTKGVVQITKLSKKEISKYHQLLHSGGKNLVDWRKQFIYFDLPLIEDIDKLK